jgi:hypothetical protein
MDSQDRTKRHRSGPFMANFPNFDWKRFLAHAASVLGQYPIVRPACGFEVPLFIDSATLRFKRGSSRRLARL